MVTRDYVYKLMALTNHLTYIHERCRSVFEITPSQYVQVKGENLILDVLNNEYPIVKSLSSAYPSLALVEKSIYDWIVFLDRKYPEERRIFGTSNSLEHEDAKNLSRDVLVWIRSIFSIYQSRGTIYLNYDSLEEMFSEQLLSGLDDSTQADLVDAYTCAIHLIPTPAAMISFRVAESVVRNIHKDMLGPSSGFKSWDNIIKELENSERVSKPFLGYLDYLRVKRNDAAHPDKRFSQEECEKILLDIKGLLEERLQLK